MNRRAYFSDGPMGPPLRLGFFAEDCARPRFTAAQWFDHALQTRYRRYTGRVWRTLDGRRYATMTTIHPTAWGALAAVRAQSRKYEDLLDRTERALRDRRKHRP